MAGKKRLARANQQALDANGRLVQPGDPVQSAKSYDVAKTWTGRVLRTEKDQIIVQIDAEGISIPRRCKSTWWIVQEQGKA